MTQPATRLETAVGLKEILVATDFSPAATAGLRVARELAQKYGARLHLVHAVWMHPFDAAADVGMPTWDWRMRIGREQLDALEHSAALKGVPVQTHLLVGLPEIVLPDTIAKESIDLVVVGASGRRGADHLLLGSTSERIVRALTCPVLTIGPGAWHARHGTEFQSILAACGPGSSAEAVVNYAARLAMEHRAQLTLLQAVPRRNSGTAALHQKAMGRLGALKPRDIAFWTPPDIRVLIGSPVDCILESAVELKSDLIVMGSRAGGGFADHIGSVTHAIICNAACPVLTLRG